MREKRAALGRQGCGKVRVCVYAQEKVGCYCTTLIHSGLKKDKTEKKNLPVCKEKQMKDREDNAGIPQIPSDESGNDMSQRRP